MGLLFSNPIAIKSAHQLDSSDRHVAELRQTLRDLVDEAEKRVLALEAELAQAKLVVTRMRKAVEDADKPFGRSWRLDNGIFASPVNVAPTAHRGAHVRQSNHAEGSRRVV
jgi:hypothetical protein